MHCKSFSHFFNKKYWQILDINVGKFNETLTNNVVSFEQPGPELHVLGILSRLVSNALILQFNTASIGKTDMGLYFFLNNMLVTVKILKFGTPQTIAIIVLKIEKFEVTLH